MRWLELSVEADVEAVEAVSEIFGRVSAGTAVRPTRLRRDPSDELAAAPDSGAPYVVTAHIPDEDGASGRVDEVERRLWHLQAFGLRPVGPLRVRAVDERDWLDAWKRVHVAQRIGRLVVVPSWLDERIEQDEVAVRLDPGMAFGTGLHPTTRACLELLQEVDPMPPAVLDVGSGSGILTIAALRLGAERAVALDTDRLAVDATRDNAERNGVGRRVEVRPGSLPDVASERFGLVMANLVAAVLVGLASRLAAHLAPGGTLVAGGIIAPRADEVVTALEGAGLAVEERRDDGEWVALRVGHRE